MFKSSVSVLCHKSMNCVKCAFVCLTNLRIKITDSLIFQPFFITSYCSLIIKITLLFSIIIMFVNKTLV